MASFTFTSRLVTTAGITAIYCGSQSFALFAEAHSEPKINCSTESSSKLLKKCRKSCRTLMCENGLPGLFIAVHKNGRLVWEQGLGYSDVENRIPSSPDSVLRIASISKSLTATLAGKFLDEGKIHLEDKVSDYIKEYPYPNISIKQLLSHTSGIRHYEKKKDSANREEKSDSEFKEFHLNKRFKSVSESLELFKNDELLSEPGEKYSYTTHGFTLLSAIIEEAEKRHMKKQDSKNGKLGNITFAALMKRMFKDLGLQSTYLDENDPIIYNRARFYIRDKEHVLKNSPYVDNSYKWAGGGFLSTVKDLCKFGDIALYSFQHTDGYLSQETAKKLWTGVVKTSPERSMIEYGLGWVITPEHETCKMCRRDPFTVDHTGGAIGASSILFIRPSAQSDKEGAGVKGVVVAVITSMEGIRLREFAKEIAQMFSEFEGDISTDS